MIHKVERNEIANFELRERGKVEPKLIGPFEILRRVVEVAYELALP